MLLISQMGEIRNPNIEIRNKLAVK